MIISELLKMAINAAATAAIKQAFSDVENMSEDELRSYIAKHEAKQDELDARREKH